MSWLYIDLYANCVPLPFVRRRQLSRDASSVVLESRWEGGTRKRRWYCPIGQKRSSWVKVHGRKYRIGVVLEGGKWGQNMDHYLASGVVLMVLVSMMKKLVDNPKIVPDQTEQVV